MLHNNAPAVAVIVFPGTNRVYDISAALYRAGLQAVQVPHDAAELPPGIALAVLPGGFSYGDYLRCGAVAARTPVVAAVRRFAEGGGQVLGICNGFQILCEAGMLPGALLPNDCGHFVCRTVALQAEATDTPFAVGDKLHWPVAHGDGRYHVDNPDKVRVAYRYLEPVNGSTDNIAGVLNERGNVCGMMPHPENADETALWQRLLEKTG